MRFPFFFVPNVPASSMRPPQVHGSEAVQLIHQIGEKQIWCAMAADGQAQDVYNALQNADHRWTRKQLLSEPWLCELVMTGLPWVISGDDPAVLARLDYNEQTGEVFDDPNLAV